MSSTRAPFCPANARSARETDMKRIRYISALLALIFALLTLGAMAFEITEQGHECQGEGCNICAVLQICDNFLSGGGAALKAAAVITAVCVLACTAAVPIKKNENTYTLISLKVRLDD